MSENQTQPTNNFPQIFQLPVQQMFIDDGFVKQIKTDGIAEYKARQNHFPQYNENRLLVDTKSCRLHLHITVNGETKSVACFCSGYVKRVDLVEYEPVFNMEAVYLVEVVLPGENTETLVIPKGLWGKKIMLQQFKDIGMSFELSKSESEILRIFTNYLAGFIPERNKGICDPRAGWFEADNAWTYRYAERWLLKTLPSFVNKKSLGYVQVDADKCLQLSANWLKGIISEEKRLLLTSIFVYGITASRIFEEFRVCQESFIILLCESERIRQWVHGFLNFFIEDSKERISLSCKTKELNQVLLMAKDQIVVIDGDAADISSRKKTNIEILNNFVGNGSNHEGTGAQALVVLLTRGIMEDISFDDAMVIELKENDFDSEFLKEKDTQRHSSYLAAGLIRRIEENPQRFMQGLKEANPKEEGLKQCMRALALIVLRLFEYCKDLSFPINLQAFDNMLDDSTAFSDLVGIGGIVIEEIVNLIFKKEVYVYNKKIPIESGKIENAIFFDNETVFLTEEVLKNLLIPKVTDGDVSPTTFRKLLFEEGILSRYNSKTGKRGYQVKILLKDKAGNRITPWVTSIPKAVFDNFSEQNLAEVLEVMMHEQ